MVGKYKEQEFNEDNYEKFYEHHNFVPIKEEDALNIHEIIPRFGWAFDKVEELKPKTLLDLGCLDGSFTLAVAKHLGINTMGVDLTKDGVYLARERADKFNLPAQYKQGTIEEWLQDFIEDEVKFDVVTCFEVIEHVKDPALMLELIDQVLAPGGSVLVSTPDFEGPTYGKDDEQNKCHIRLYTTADKDYEAVNKYGTTRKATSITQQVGKDRIREMGVHNQLINVWYQ
jgi:2-polyprenyl-3-methyl-5-hydroxy-6-metoxy-1,4-benzoquinol methylase